MPVRRRFIKRVLIGLAITLLLSPVLFSLALRMGRSHIGKPYPVRGEIVGVENLFVPVFAARAGSQIVLFDTGIDVEGQALDALLDALHAGRDDVKHIFLTHGHFDHVAHAGLCKSAKVHLGAADLGIVTQREPTATIGDRIFSAMLPTPPYEPNTTHTGVWSLALEGGKEVLAIPLPGDTAGAYVYLYDGVLFTGDSIHRHGNHLGFALPIFAADMAQNRRSIAGLGAALTGHNVEVVCTGHEGCTAEGRGGPELADLIARAQKAD